MTSRNVGSSPRLYILLGIFRGQSHEELFVLFSGTAFNISGNMAKDDIYRLVSRSRYCLFVFRTIFWSKILTLEQNCLNYRAKMNGADNSAVLQFSNSSNFFRNFSKRLVN